MHFALVRPQFSERFKEVKEAARLAREKSQDKMEFVNTALSIAAPQVSSDISTVPQC